MLVPQQAADLGQARAMTQHLAGQRMAELMRSMVPRVHPRPRDGGAYDRANAGL